MRAFCRATRPGPTAACSSSAPRRTLFGGAASPAEIKAFFAQSSRRHGGGLAALASAYWRRKDEASAKALARKLWTDIDIPASLEAGFLKRVGGAAHGGRPQAPARPPPPQRQPLGRRAQRARRRHPPRHRPAVGAEQKKAEARLAVFLRAKNSQQLFSKLPRRTAQTEWGSPCRGRRPCAARRRTEEAWKILLAEPEIDAAISARRLVGGAARQRLCRAAGRASPRLAYELVRNPGPLSRQRAKDAAFLAGWLALRHLQRPQAGARPLPGLAKAADGPLSRPAAEYWLGRTYEALGDQAKAQEHYKAASAYFDTFHGQLARLKLDAAAQRPEDHAAGGAHARRRSRASTAPTPCRPP